jgi:hypothetical protein
MRLTYQVKRHSAGAHGCMRRCVCWSLRGRCLLAAGCAATAAWVRWPRHCGLSNPWYYTLHNSPGCKPPSNLPAPQDDAPDEYEPPHFTPASEEQANGAFAAQPFSMKVGGPGLPRDRSVCPHTPTAGALRAAPATDLPSAQSLYACAGGAVASVATRRIITLTAGANAAKALTLPLTVREPHLAPPSASHFCHLRPLLPPLPQAGSLSTEHHRVSVRVKSMLDAVEEAAMGGEPLDEADAAGAAAAAGGGRAPAGTTAHQVGAGGRKAARGLASERAGAFCPA